MTILARYELTPRQEMIRAMREDQKSGGDPRGPDDKQRPFTEIAKELNITVSSVRQQYRYGQEKRRGLRGTTDSRQPHPGQLPEPIGERDDPEMVAGAMDALTEPLLNLKKAIEESGLPPKAVEGMIRRLRARYMPQIEGVKAYRVSEMIAAIDNKITMMLKFMNPQVMAEASARDLAMAFGIFVEKRQLLKGEPTQIISQQERVDINRMVPLLIAECRRRGIALPTLQVAEVLAPEQPALPETKPEERLQ